MPWNSLEFWSLVDIRKPTECWPWKGGKCSGYGRLKHVFAHRIAYELFSGTPITEGFVLHKCDNRICVNPNHLYLGTQADNIHDRSQRGSTLYGRPPKLNVKDIEALRSMRRTGKYRLWELSSIFGLSEGHISKILNGKYGGRLL